MGFCHVLQNPRSWPPDNSHPVAGPGYSGRILAKLLLNLHESATKNGIFVRNSTRSADPSCIKGSLYCNVPLQCPNWIAHLHFAKMDKYHSIFRQHLLLRVLLAQKKSQKTTGMKKKGSPEKRSHFRKFSPKRVFVFTQPDGGDRNSQFDWDPGVAWCRWVRWDRSGQME